MAEGAELEDITIEDFPKWHALGVDNVLEAQSTNWVGLSSQEAAQRLKKYGENELTPPPKVSRHFDSLGREL